MGICYNLEQDKNMVKVPSADNDLKELKQSPFCETKILHNMNSSVVVKSYNIKYVGKMNLNSKNQRVINKT